MCHGNRISLVPCTAASDYERSRGEALLLIFDLPFHGHPEVTCRIPCSTYSWNIETFESQGEIEQQSVRVQMRGTKISFSMLHSVIIIWRTRDERGETREYFLYIYAVGEI